VIVLAIDPGPTESAWVLWDGSRLHGMGIDPNETALLRVGGSLADRLAVEMVASYGMAVGEEVFSTVFWAGRLVQAWGGQDWTGIYRLDVKLHLCHSARAKDSNIRQVLIDRLGPPGTKAKPGVTYGVRTHLWSALAVAVTAWDKQNEPAGRAGERG